MAGYKTFVAGEEALAADVNSYLMSQTVARFANASARSAGLTAPALGQLSMLDTRPGALQFWNGSAWASCTVENWVSANSNTPALPSQTNYYDIPLTMPCAGKLIVDWSGQIQLTNAGGNQVVCGIHSTSTPAPSATFVGNISLVDTVANGQVRIAAVWDTVTAGQIVTVKVYIQNLGGLASARLNQIWGFWRVIP